MNSASESSATFNGTESILSTGVDTNAVDPQPIKKIEAESDRNDSSYGSRPAWNQYAGDWDYQDWDEAVG